MTRFIDMTGQRFGQLIVIKKISYDSTQGIHWECQCDCGTIKIIRSDHLRKGLIKSCGCLRRTHGDSNSVEWNIWRYMKDRCTNPKCTNWKNYGGRGIKVCNEWLNDYSAFLSHVGRRPSSEHSLDRINNDRNYEPGNVRWAMKWEQNSNRRT